MCLPQASLSYRFLHLSMLPTLRLRYSILGRPNFGLVGLDGLEPSTSRLSGVRSSHLSYRPVFSQVFQFVHLSRFYPWWWRWRDSNPWPPACRAGALPTELHPRKGFIHFQAWLKPDNWTTKVSVQRVIHIYQDFVLIWLRSLKNVSRS